VKSSIEKINDKEDKDGEDDEKAEAEAEEVNKPSTKKSDKKPK
jgi:hypothetical protein